jgi:hypothetical protein
MSFLPRPASPPRALHSKGSAHSRIRVALHHQQAPYPLSEDESVPSRPGEGRVSARDDCRTTYRPPYVREATDRGTERASMPSPKHSRDSSFYPEDISESTEEIERTERHVTFRDPERYDSDQEMLIGKNRLARR